MAAGRVRPGPRNRWHCTAGAAGDPRRLGWVVPREPVDSDRHGYYGNTVTTLTFKVTDEEARLIRSRARRERLTVSEYLRRRASISLAAASKPGRVRCSHTGALIFASPENQAPLTTDAVRELLSDFP